MRIFRYIQPARRSFASALPFSRNPWTGLESEINRLFETALTDVASAPASRQFPVDLYEDKDNTYVRAELPGVNREDINVELADGYLTIAATRKAPAVDGKDGESYSLSRSVSVPEAVQAEKVAAAYENGVLTVTLPKREETKPRKITVAVK
ncbi:MAG TPA: Hsp20/alpha crystallin family protein [Opitutaceae bacterium]|jgi:HSP20 family protein|nr:Hsp20/alpha crystallin family protein [Opitutaceae bacterium]